MRLLVGASAFLVLALSPAVAGPQIVPFPPGFLDAEWLDGHQGGVLLRLTWQAPNDTGSSALAMYRVHRVASGEGQEVFSTFNASSTSATDVDVQISGTYAYYVTAINTDGWESPPSEVLMVRWDYPHCRLAGYTLGPPPDYLLQPDCLFPPPV